LVQGPRLAEFQVAAQISQSPVEVGQERRVVGGVLESLARHAPQEQHRVALAFLQHVGIEVLEKPVGPGVPGPSKVVGEFLETTQTRGDVRMHAELMDLFHGRIIPP